MSILEQLLSAIAPHTCVGCQAEGLLLCATCTENLVRVPSRCYRCQRTTPDFQTCSACLAFTSLTQVWAFTPYNGAPKRLIHAIKFDRVRSGTRDVGRVVATLLSGDDFVLTHVPTATTRVRARGYDQAELITKEIAKQLHCPYLPLIARTSQERQVGHGRQERIQSLQHAFRPLPAVQKLRKSVVLIDDVLTTGATLEAAAKVLYESGVPDIRAAVFASA